MKSKTKISKQAERKFNPELVETINLAKKKDSWMGAASVLSGPRKNRISLNISEINEKAGDSKKVLVLGKVLSQGEMNKKVKVIAFDFSDKAKEKLLSSGCGVSNIIDEIKSNPGMKDIKILKNENN